MTAVAQTGGRGATDSAPIFPPNHAWDRNFFLLYAGLIWLGILMGFGGDILHHVQTHETPYPLIVHVHAAVFVSWLVLFTVQILLIRTHRLDVHRKLGLAMTGVAGVMLILGPAVAIFMDHRQFGTPDSDPSFIAVQLTDILSFAGLVSAGVLLRRQSSAHKRLMLMSTLYISDAGFSRWLSPAVSHLLGNGWWGEFFQSYLGNDVLILGVGAYDLITRRRLHPVYLMGLVWVLGNQLTANGLYMAPFWKPIATHIIGH